MLLHTQGIVFRTMKYGETSIITDIFTEEKGLHSFIAGSVRTARAKMPYSLFQPMSVIDAIAYYREDPGVLNRLKEVRAGVIFTAIPFDIRRGAVALFMAEICRKSIQEAEENRDLFHFLLDNLRWLDTTMHPIANLHLHFLLHLSAFLGFEPQSDDVSGTVFFDLKEGTFSHTSALHDQYMNALQTTQMLALLQVTLEDCHTVLLTRAERKALLQKLLQFYQLHISGFSDVHTPDVLDMIF